MVADEHADAVAEEEAHFTQDEQIEDVFEDRQNLSMGGRKELKEELEEHTATSPTLSGGDLDAQWQAAEVSGEETVGGTTPTPDQDVVEELGEAMGITYEDDEPLHTEEKLRERDRNRWELNPESSREEAEAGYRDQRKNLTHKKGENDMGFNQYHEPPEELSQETRTFARMIVSLIEEAEAIDWYAQRLDVEKDEEARAVMAQARKEEFIHFGMDLEFLLRRTPQWRTILETILFQDGDLVKLADKAEKAVSKK